MKIKIEVDSSMEDLKETLKKVCESIQEYENFENEVEIKVMTNKFETI